MNGDTLTRIMSLPTDRRALLLRKLAKHAPRAQLEPGDYDVAIIGGGVAGMTLALQLIQSARGVRVVVLEREQHPIPETAYKVGESTVEIAAHYLRDVIGLDEHLRTQQLRKFGLRMFFSDHDNSDIGRRVEVGSSVFPPLTTYQLDRGRLENALAKRCLDQGVDYREPCKVERVALASADGLHTVHLHEGDSRREIRARWVVDASGRRRLLQRQLGLAKPDGHAANAAWLRIGHPIDIKEWTEDPDWHSRVTQGDRALSTNHLMGHGYWVWLIRLASDAISIGIVADASVHSFEGFNQFERALQWLQEHEPQCAAAIKQHVHQVQDFKVMKDYSYGCTQVFAGADRWCVTGEAGLFLDPLYSPGLDMIAISNGLITDLVTRDLAGEDVTARAAIHDKLFLRLADIWLAIYRGQYTLMGNAEVTTSKVIWDTAFYWGVFGLLFFNDKFRSMIEHPAVAEGLEKLTLVSNRIQAFFREWNALDHPELPGGFVDLYKPLNFMVSLHEGITVPLAPAQFEARFTENVRLFEQLAGQLICTVMSAYANRPRSDVALEQIQRWQMDPLLHALIATYRREARGNPTSDRWITLSGHALVRQPELVTQDDPVTQKELVTAAADTGGN